MSKIETSRHRELATSARLKFWSRLLMIVCLLFENLRFLVFSSLLSLGKYFRVFHILLSDTFNFQNYYLPWFKFHFSNKLEWVRELFYSWTSAFMIDYLSSKLYILKFQTIYFLDQYYYRRIKMSSSDNCPTDGSQEPASVELVIILFESILFSYAWINLSTFFLGWEQGSWTNY